MMVLCLYLVWYGEVYNFVCVFYGWLFDYYLSVVGWEMVVVVVMYVVLGGCLVMVLYLLLLEWVQEFVELFVDGFDLVLEIDICLIELINVFEGMQM